MRTIPMRWTELETAFERNAPDTESFVDARTGEAWSSWSASRNPRSTGQGIAGGDRYLESSPPVAGAVQVDGAVRGRGWTDPALRERLIIAIDGKGASAASRTCS